MRRTLMFVFVAVALGVFAATGLAEEHAGDEGLAPVSTFAGIADETQRSQALFTEAAKVMLHPRCINCHPADDSPLQGEDGRLHQPAARRGTGGLGVVGIGRRPDLRDPTPALHAEELPLHRVVAQHGAPFAAPRLEPRQRCVVVGLAAVLGVETDLQRGVAVDPDELGLVVLTGVACLGAPEPDLQPPAVPARPQRSVVIVDEPLEGVEDVFEERRLLHRQLICPVADAGRNRITNRPSSIIAARNSSQSGWAPPVIVS